MSKRYFTTPIYYVNDAPHIGHAYCTLALDVISRHHRLLGEEVFFTTGIDENASKNVDVAISKGMKIHDYLDHMASIWENTWISLNVSYDKFVRTTSEEHTTAVLAFLDLCMKNGDIYLKSYTALYCKGCESFKIERELIDGKCPDHNLTCEEVSEENYFFALSKYKSRINEFYSKNPEALAPKHRVTEILNLLENIEDFSISRKGKNWGIQFPNDKEHTIYVWFDALISYLSAVSFPEESYKEYFENVEHLVGKDIVKFHAIYWPAMLMSAGIKPFKKLYAHGFLTIEGTKMSKTLKNFVTPLELTERFGTDALRVFFFQQVPFGQDGDYNQESLTNCYNAFLANGIGNVYSRICAMAASVEEELPYDLNDYEYSLLIDDSMKIAYENFELEKVCSIMFERVTEIDKFITTNKIWEKTGEEKHVSLSVVIAKLRKLCVLIEPLIPNGSLIMRNNLFQSRISKAEPLFARV